MSLLRFWYILLGKVLLSLQLASVPAFCCALRLALRVHGFACYEVITDQDKLAVRSREGGTVVSQGYHVISNLLYGEIQKGLGDGLWSGESKWGR